MPSASSPTTATMSSCGRPLRGTVCARDPAYAWPVTQAVRSMSWVARSMTTPTSAIRCGNGPCRRVDHLEDLAQLAGLEARRRLCSAGL